MIQDVIDAIEVRNWYALAAVLLTFAVQVLRKTPWLRDAIWSRIPDGARWLVPVLGGAVIAFVGAHSEGKELLEALNTALVGGLSIGLGSMGFAATLRESPIPWDGKSGGKDDDDPPTGAKPVGLVVGAMALAVVGCASASDKPPCDSETAARMASACALRVELECVQAGLSEESCHVIDECDAAAEKRKAECLR